VELADFEDCRHFLAEEAPERVVEAIRELLGRSSRCPYVSSMSLAHYASMIAAT